MGEVRDCIPATKWHDSTHTGCKKGCVTSLRVTCSDHNRHEEGKGHQVSACHCPCGEGGIGKHSLCRKEPPHKVIAALRVPIGI